MSAMPSEPGCDEYMLPVSPCEVLVIGTPSITYSAWLLCEILLGPRITTRVAPPIPAEEALMLIPATLPLSEFMKLVFFTVVSSSVPTFCTL